MSIQLHVIPFLWMLYNGMLMQLNLMHVTDGWMGCIRGVRVNGQPNDLMDESKQADSVNSGKQREERPQQPLFTFS